MAEPILTVEHLIKAYGETPVLDDISFAVNPGKVINAAFDLFDKLGATDEQDRKSVV